MFEYLSTDFTNRNDAVGFSYRPFLTGTTEDTLWKFPKQYTFEQQLCMMIQASTLGFNWMTHFFKANTKIKSGPDTLEEYRRVDALICLGSYQGIIQFHITDV